MSIKSKIAAIAAASLGMVLTQSSAPRAETEDDSAPGKVTKIVAPIDVDEDVLYSALPDEFVEKAAGFGGTVHLASLVATCAATCSGVCNQPQQSVRAPPYSGLKSGAPKGSTGPTVPPKPAQGNKNK